MVRTPIIVLFLVAVATHLNAQSIEFTAWEKQTFLKQPPEKIMNTAGIAPGMTIGEIGAGYGRFTLHLASRVGSSGRIYANDINKEALDSLLNRCERAGLTNVELILGQNDDPLFPAGSLDLAIMVWTYHWFDHPVTVLKNLKHALKPDATVVLV
jgi:ubiquinone/menaquinone biosynthesis C-methylase UbiE